MFIYNFIMRQKDQDRFAIGKNERKHYKGMQTFAFDNYQELVYYRTLNFFHFREKRQNRLTWQVLDVCILFRIPYLCDNIAIDYDFIHVPNTFIQL